ncbi:hypothetical protein CALVIDRAFT_537354, partial [Calocera viscosa TUFC12733]
MASTPSPCRNVKQDVWRCIFEVIVDGARTGSVVLPLLQVCKDWKAIAEPLLYRYLIFNNPASLEQCNQSLVRHSLRGLYYATATRTIKIPETISTPGWGLPLERIFHYTSHLHEFNAVKIELGTEALDSLRQTCGQSLRRLTLRVGGDSTKTAALQMVLLSRFRLLERLDIYIRGPADVSELSGGDSPIFDMPVLTRLTLACSRRESLAELIEFVSLGRYPALVELWLNLPMLEHGPSGGTPCDVVLPLLRRVGPQLLLFSLCAPYALEAARSFFPLLKKVRMISLTLGPQPQILGDFLPDSLAQLRFQIHLDVLAEEQALLATLDHITLSKNHGRNLKRVQVDSTGAEEFHWMQLSVANPELAGKLMLRSLRLQSKRIHLTDQWGRWVGQWVHGRKSC